MEGRLIGHGCLHNATQEISHILAKTQTLANTHARTHTHFKYLVCHLEVSFLPLFLNTNRVFL